MNDIWERNRVAIKGERETMFPSLVTWDPDAFVRLAIEDDDRGPRVAADPNPMPHLRLFRWGRRRA